MAVLSENCRVLRASGGFLWRATHSPIPTIAYGLPLEGPEKHKHECYGWDLRCSPRVSCVPRWGLVGRDGSLGVWPGRAYSHLWLLPSLSLCLLAAVRWTAFLYHTLPPWWLFLGASQPWTELPKRWAKVNLSSFVGVRYCVSGMRKLTQELVAENATLIFSQGWPSRFSHK